MPLNRRQAAFIVRFLLLLIIFYAISAIPFVDRHAIEPFTSGLARLSGGILHLFGEKAAIAGTTIRGESFAVDIKNGCNGIEAVVFLCAAILAFDAPRRARLIGVVASAIAIELLNLIRIVSLYLLGRYHRSVFDAFHLAVWQSVIFGAAVMIFVFWTSRLDAPAAA